MKSFQSTNQLSLNSDSNCMFDKTTYSTDGNNYKSYVYFSEKGLHTMHLNIQRFMPNYDEITLMLKEEKSKKGKKKLNSGVVDRL